MSPHIFLTCCFFSSSRAGADTGFGLKEMGGRRGRGATEIAVGITMEKRERPRCCGCGCFDSATTVDLVGLLPAAIEAHDAHDDDDSCFCVCF